METTESGVEEILDVSGRVLAIVIKSAVAPTSTTFVTPDEAALQVGFVVYGAGGEVARHRHLPIERNILGTSEVIVIRKGSTAVRIYDDAGQPVARRDLSVGDVVLMTAGGHGFEMLEDTILLEIKQGPYTGVQEKERF